MSAPMPRTVRVRPFPNGRSTPRHRGQGMSPASRISSAARGTARPSWRTSEIHASQHCLSHPAEGRGRLVLQGANSHRVPSRSCRPDPLSVSARRSRAGAPRPTWVSRFVGAVVTPTNHHRAHPVSASPVTTTPRGHRHPRWCSTAARPRTPQPATAHPPDPSGTPRCTAPSSPAPSNQTVVITPAIIEQVPVDTVQHERPLQIRPRRHPHEPAIPATCASVRNAMA